MNIDVGLGTLLLAVISFIIGTLVPTIFRRLSYEGLSIRQPFQMDIVTGGTSDSSNRTVYVTVVKIANARGESALIDDIQLALPTKDNIDTRLTEIVLRVLSPGDAIYAPLDANVQIISNGAEIIRKEYRFPEGSSWVFIDKPLFSYLPFIVKANEELLVAIQFPLSMAVKKVLMGSINTPRKLVFRVNGKYRTYAVHFRDFEGSL